MDCVGEAAGTDCEAERPPASWATGLDGAAGGVGAEGGDRVVAGTDGLDGAAAAKRLQSYGLTCMRCVVALRVRDATSKPSNVVGAKTVFWSLDGYNAVLTLT
jgi:hypothetical protein